MYFTLTKDINTESWYGVQLSLIDKMLSDFFVNYLHFKEDMDLYLINN